MLPMVWVQQLAKAERVGTLKLAIYLRHVAWKTGEARIKLSNAAAATAGVASHDSKSRALAELEMLGLVVVERRPRHSPVITVLALPEKSGA
jgi:hypothetical protein